MNKFKVGDWVRSDAFGIGKIGSINKGCTTTVRIEGWYTIDTRDKTRNYDIHIQHCRLWEPKIGEWCWFLFDKDEPEKAEFGQFVEMFNGDLYVSKQNKADAFEYCEPFIGSLPSFLKDAK